VTAAGYAGMPAMEVVLPTCIGPPDRLFSDLERARILAQSLKYGVIANCVANVLTAALC